MSSFIQSSQFTQLGDHFKISVYSQVTSGVIGVSGRLRDIDGRYSNFEHRVTITATGLQTVRFPASGAWWILSCVAQVVSGTINPGDVLVKVELVQGDVSTALSHQVLLFGSPDNFAPLTMGSPGEFSVDGRKGRIVAQHPANPAINTDYIFTVPAGVMWAPVACYFEITTIPVTGAALAYVTVSNAVGDLIWTFTIPAAIGPGATYQIVASLGGAAYAMTASPGFQASLPSLLLLPGATINYSYYNEVGDIQMGRIYLSYVETILGY